MGMFDDPSLLPYLGLLQGLGQSAQPSRLPVSNLTVLGDLAGGLAKGMGAQAQTRGLNEETAGKRLGNLGGLLDTNLYRRALGLDPLTEDDVYGATGGRGGHPQPSNETSRFYGGGDNAADPEGQLQKKVGDAEKVDPTAPFGTPGSTFDGDPDAPGTSLRPILAGNATQGPAPNPAATAAVASAAAPSPSRAASSGLPFAIPAGSGGRFDPGTAMLAASAGGAGGASSAASASGAAGGRGPWGLNLGPYSMGQLTIMRKLYGPQAVNTILSRYNTPTDLEKARLYQAAHPDDPLGALAARKAAGLDNSVQLRQNSLFGHQDDTGRLVPDFYNPSLPIGTSLGRDASGNLVAFGVPGADARLAQVKGIEEGAAGARERQTAGFKNYLDFGSLGLTDANGNVVKPTPGPTVPPGATGADAVAGNDIFKPRPLAFKPAAGAPAAAAGAPPQGRPGIDAPLKLDDGTMIPPISMQPPIKQGAKFLEPAGKSWQEQEDAMTAGILPAQQTIKRIDTIANAFKLTGTDYFASHKAELSAMLDALGIHLNKDAFGDPAQVQLALHENYVKTIQFLKTQNSRWTQAEFSKLSTATYNPNLKPEANLQMIAEDAGFLRQQIAEATGWQKARQLGWQSPADYKTAWAQLNPAADFVQRERARIGPLKGMDDGKGTAKPAAAAPPPVKPDMMWDPQRGLFNQ